MDTKQKMPIWKKLLIGFGILIVILFTLPFIFPTDYYKEGIDSYNKQNFQKALYNFNNVKPEDKNYNDAISKIKELKPIVDSLNKQVELAKKEKQDNKEKKKVDETQPNETKVGKESKENSIKGSIGQSYDLGPLTYKIERVKFKKFIGGIYTLNKADGVFLIITLTVTNKEQKQILIDNSFFRLVDEGGAVYDYSPDGTATLELTEFPGETFMGMTINPNVSKKAKVVFEVPTKKKNYKLVFSDPFSDEYLEIDMNE